ncbi:hypothetical protein PGT21_020101 [Puccinia graminis f. sp. tritici]|uniref:Uncharacterized protein n=1 Tax=Puccinia graminis f. sp. tritici TaxID=56615 RepID=A0A5B0P0F7_PUCGR|nr:hypothetical protein PGT21_020101 [Puccinia graminis f. sp. tritici]
MIAHHENREKRAEGISCKLYIPEGAREAGGQMQSSNAIDPMAMECLSDGHGGSYVFRRKYDALITSTELETIKIGSQCFRQTLVIILTLVHQPRPSPSVSAMVCRVGHSTHRLDGR